MLSQNATLAIKTRVLFGRYFSVVANMAEAFDIKQWGLTSTPDLIQQMAALVWLKKGDDHKQLYETVTGARVAYELYQRMSSERDIETYQAQCILAIVDYVKKHPKASEQELAKEVEKQIELFKFKIDTM